VSEPRIIPLEGGRNVRDLGGYPTADGRTTRWRTLFRSGSLSRLTTADRAVLDALGIRAVFDLRTDAERDSEPHPWPAGGDVLQYRRSYDASGGELLRLLHDPSVTGDDARRAMIANYRILPYEQAPSYRALFEGLADGMVPALFNCTAGKDRTGVAAALLLSMLGVSRDLVIEDYRLTERAFDFRSLVDSSRSDGRTSGAALDSAVVEALIAAHPDYIGACFEEIDARHGGVSAYLAEVVGLPAAMQDRLRDTLLSRD
jgi:protein-tyrosine phosphatase